MTVSGPKKIGTCTFFVVSPFSNPSDGKFTKKKFRVSQPWSGGPGGPTKGWGKVKFFPAHFANHMTPKKKFFFLGWVPDPC